MKRIVLTLGLAAAVTACGPQVTEVIHGPEMTPVGSGLHATPISHVTVPTVRPAYTSANSFWQDSGADLFRDPRAMRAGDVMTVKISIKDRASLDNSSNTKRQASRDLDLKLKYGLATGFEGKSFASKGDGDINPSVTSNTSSKGEGGVSRSESIDLLVAAVVTDVLPNGYLVISGTQEVRVNFEVRELSVAGIVRPRDISTDNSISYDKIAEARISYGGRGRVMEVQRPGWGHQIADVLLPF